MATTTTATKSLLSILPLLREIRITCLTAGMCDVKKIKSRQRVFYKFRGNILCSQPHDFRKGGGFACFLGKEKRKGFFRLNK